MVETFFRPHFKNSEDAILIKLTFRFLYGLLTSSDNTLLKHHPGGNLESLFTFSIRGGGVEFGELYLLSKPCLAKAMYLPISACGDIRPGRVEPASPN